MRPFCAPPPPLPLFPFGGEGEGRGVGYSNVGGMGTGARRRRLGLWGMRRGGGVRIVGVVVCMRLKGGIGDFTCVM